MELFSIKNINKLFDGLVLKEVSLLMYNMHLNEGMMTIDEGDECEKRRVIAVKDRYDKVGKILEIEDINMKLGTSLNQRFYLNFVQSKQLAKRVDEIWVRNRR